MATAIFGAIYSTSPVGASSNKKTASADRSGTGDVTVTDADGTLVAGDTFTATYGTTTLNLTYTGGGTDGFFATDGGGNVYYISNNTTIPLNTNLGTPNAGASTSVCFMAGTLIATAEGDVPVEDLKTGMLVRTASGALRPVKWLGVQRVSYQFMSRAAHMPVRIRAGALGDQKPKRDLRVSPGHALLIDGVLCNAAALVNGTSIVRDDPQADFDYYHVELDGHDLLISEGVASESYLCLLDRNRFTNADDYRAASADPDTPVMPMPLPRATVPSQLPQSVRERILGKRVA